MSSHWIQFLYSIYKGFNLYDLGMYPSATLARRCWNCPCFSSSWSSEFFKYLSSLFCTIPNLYSLFWLLCEVNAHIIILYGSFLLRTTGPYHVKLYFLLYSIWKAWKSPTNLQLLFALVSYYFDISKILIVLLHQSIKN